MEKQLFKTSVIKSGDKERMSDSESIIHHGGYIPRALEILSLTF